ncbi:hypothetical protein QP535_01705 [Lactobacillus crispatus]|uniref:hypothetical protein n=1 Tax=Lactobacillus crispatus TaxID=47770 RepID=UPI002550809C|nr:hypothetical protein [Lactobacillus crispatus]MDK7582419.1 hypothetical protein [Lactobacillus crispatus]
MQVLNDWKMPNKETLYFNDHIVPWIEKEEWANNEHTEVALTFKKNTPVDIINKFLICRSELAY